jgi:hypothetical protein
MSACEIREQPSCSPDVALTRSSGLRIPLQSRRAISLRGAGRRQFSDRPLQVFGAAVTRDSSAVAVTASIGRPFEPARRIFAPGPELIEHSRGHQEAQRKAVGEPLDSFPAPLGAIRDVLRRYRVPGEDMENGVREVEMPPRRGLAAIDPHFLTS